MDVMRSSCWPNVCSRYTTRHRLFQDLVHKWLVPCGQYRDVMTSKCQNGDKHSGIHHGRSCFRTLLRSMLLAIDAPEFFLLLGKQKPIGFIALWPSSYPVEARTSDERDCCFHDNIFHPLHLQTWLRRQKIENSKIRPYPGKSMW